MNEIASSAPTSPSQPASENYEEFLQLERKCTVARDNFVNSVKMHADLLRKMGNPDLYVDLDDKLSKTLKKGFFTDKPHYKLLSKPEIQNNIRGYAKNMEGFLRDFKDLPLDKCDLLLVKASLCVDYRVMLMS